MNAAQYVERLVAYGIAAGLITELDAPMARNSLLDNLRLDEPEEDMACAVGLIGDGVPSPTAFLAPLIEYALANGLIENDTETERDLFDTKLMGCLMPRPSETASQFEAIFNKQGPKAACDWFYELCIKSGYIRAERVAKNIAWNHESKYGSLEVTINLSKPEKDPREVARLKTMPQVGYPKCQLCLSNVGYKGRLNHPARQTLRVLPLTLNGERWYFQFSPYVYYNQHCIVLRHEHIPMKISRDTIVRLLEFITVFPHYFIGSNAGLPIVGGSILNHDHFQGGVWTMPMSQAKAAVRLRQDRWPGLSAEIIRWPMSVLRIRHADASVLTEAASEILGVWERHSNTALGIHSHSGDTPHNAVTPIARRRGTDYELDIVLRNNRTDEQHKLGIFHVHDDLHHIKKENIGLIEVMGLFILPGRLETEFEGLAGILCGQERFDAEALGNPAHPLNKHLPWLRDMMTQYGLMKSREEAMAVIKRQCGEKCVRVLDDCGVFKDDEAGMKGFLEFVETAGFTAL